MNAAAQAALASLIALAGVGIDWRLAPRWRLGASLGYSPLHVEAHFRTRAADGAVLARARSHGDLDVGAPRSR
jgi:hypothetical protein